MGYLTAHLRLSTLVVNRQFFVPLFLNNWLIFGPPKKNNDEFKHISFATPESDFTAPTFEEFIKLFGL